MPIHRSSRRLFLVVAMTALLVGACTRATAPPTGGAPTSPPSALTPPPSSLKQWDKEPEMIIDPHKIYLATFKTEKGDIKIQLFADKAPKTVNNLVFLARQGYYDNTTFHRVLPNFMAQGGDPTGTGSGGPGYRFEDEIDPSLRFDDGGYLAMANAGPNTNGSQFFITFVPTPWLNGSHTIFGKVVAGMDVLLSLTPRDPTENPTYPGDLLKTIEITEIAESLLPPPTPTPVPTVPVPEEGRPLSKLDIAARENLYTGKPAMVIDTAKSYLATVTTTRGDITIQLYPQDAPESVNNFVVLANLGYWDGFPIVFVEPGVFVVTGSPGGAPDSDIGYAVPSERKRSNVTGAVGYWFREDRFGSSASQFYILLQDIPAMDQSFTAFGEVTAGLEVVRALTVEDKVEKITITEK